MEKKLTLPVDWLDLLKLLTSSRVEFVVTGGVAFSFHVKPRYTADLDIVVLPELENIKRFIKVFKEFGFQLRDDSPEQFLTGKKLLRVGVEPNMIDVMNFFTGAEIVEIISDRIWGEVSGVRIPFVSIDHLISNKSAVGRPEDLGDLAKLKKLGK